MTRLLLLEGNTADKRAKAHQLGVRNSSEIYAHAISAQYPAIELLTLNGADPDWALPHGLDWTDFDGFVVTGSSLHAYDPHFAVINQIELLKRAAEAALPIFGSCWGLQIAAVAAGGSVARSPRGREVGIARKILLNETGRAHPMFTARPTVFDAPCIHYDEVVQLPEGATLLASNRHSVVQAAIIPLGKSEIWAVQYHPEFDLEQLVQLYDLYAEDMVAQGFAGNAGELQTYREQIASLALDPTNQGLAWQLGIDSDILDDSQRRAEIIAWIEGKVLGAT